LTRIVEDLEQRLRPSIDIDMNIEAIEFLVSVSIDLPLY
jgi:hypothetical protein